MSDLEVQYRKSRTEEENRRMNEFFAKPDPYPYDPSAASAGEVHGPPEATTGQKLKSVGKGAVSGAVEGAKTGYHHFVKGMIDTWQASGEASMGARAKGILSGEGEMALGALNLFITALGVPSAMEATKKGIQGFFPGMNNSVFAGRDVAKNIRVFMGLPSLIADPDIRKLMFADLKDLKGEEIVQQQELFEELSKEMTYGEFFELVSGFVIPFGAVKGLKSFKKWTTPPSPPPTAKPYDLSAVGGAAREGIKQQREEVFKKTQTEGAPRDPLDVETIVPGLKGPKLELVGRPQLSVEEQKILRDRAKTLEEVYQRTQTKAPDPLDIETPITDPLRVQAAAKSARTPAQEATMSLEDFAARFQAMVEGQGGGEAGKSTQGGAKGRTKAPSKAEEKPAKPAEKETTPYEEPVSPPEYADPPTELKTALGTATTHARETILEEIKATPELAGRFKEKAGPSQGRGIEAPKDIIARMGGEFVGIDEKGTGVHFAEPESGTPLKLHLRGLTEDHVLTALNKARKEAGLKSVEKPVMSMTSEGDIAAPIPIEPTARKGKRPKLGEMGPIKIPEDMGSLKEPMFGSSVKDAAPKWLDPYGNPMNEADLNQYVKDIMTSSTERGTKFDPERFAKLKELIVAKLKPFRGQSGKISPELLAQMAVGAAVGITQGDTLEERIGYGLFGFLGARGATAVARRLSVKFKTDPKVAPLLSPTNPQMPGFAGPPPDVPVGMQRAIDAIAPGEKGTLHKIITRNEETILSEVERRTGLIIEQKAWEKVKELSDEATARGSASPALRDSFALAYTLSKNNEGGRFWGGATGARGTARVKVAKKEIHKLAREWDPSKSDLDLAKAIHGLGAIENVRLAARLNYAVPEAGLQAFMSGLLFSKALVKNALGSAPMIPLSVAERSIAAFSPRAWMTGAERPGVTEGMRMVAPAAKAIVNQLRMVNKWDKLGEQSVAMGTTHMEIMPRGFEALAQMAGEEFGAPTLAKGFEWLGHAANLAPEVMRRTDGSFKAIAGDMSSRVEGMQVATREGLKGEAFWNRVVELETDYSKLPEASLQNITDFRNHQTFTQPFESELMRAIQMGPTDPWLQLGYRVVFFPFVRTGIRLGEFTVEHVPVLTTLTTHAWKEWNKGGTPRALVEARQATGGMILAGGAWLAMQGLITGNMPGHPKDVSMEHAGRPNRVFWDLISQKYRSYDGLEPLSTMVSMGADFAYLANRLPEKDVESLLTAFGVAFANNINSRQFLQSVGQLYDIVTNGSTDAQWEKGLQFIRTRLQSGIPAVLKEVFSGTEKQRVVPSGAYDKDKSVLSAAQRELQILFDTFKRNTGQSDAETIVYDRNIFTGDIIRDDTWPFNPYTIKETTDAPWARELRRLEGAGLERLPDWIGKEGPADVGMSDKLEAPGVRLTAKQIDRRAVLMTQIVKDAHGKFTQSLDQLVQSESYKRADNDHVRKDRIHERWISFRLRAEDKLMDEFKDLDAAVRLQTGLHQIERYMPGGRQPKARMELELRHGRKGPVGTQVVP